MLTKNNQNRLFSLHSERLSIIGLLSVCINSASLWYCLRVVILCAINHRLSASHADKDTIYDFLFAYLGLIETRNYLKS